MGTDVNLTQSQEEYIRMIEEGWVPGGTWPPDFSPYLFVRNYANTGMPEYYIDRGMQFQLHPIPDGAYTITLRYYAQPVDFTVDADFDYISNFHFEAVIFGTVMRGALFLDDDAKVQKYTTLYERAIGEMIKKEKDKKLSDVTVRMKTFKDFSVEQFKRIVKVNN